MDTLRTGRRDPAHPVDHAHVADLETCLDLINTVELTDGVPEDHLPSLAARIEWLAGRNLAHQEDLARQASSAPGAWLDRFAVARASLREVWDAAVEGRAADAAAVASVNDLLACAPHPRLEPAARGVVV